MAEHHEQILDETGLSLADFGTIYKRLFTVTEFPIPDDEADITEEERAATQQQRIATSVPSRINVIATLVTPIEALVLQEKKLESDISLKKLLTSTEQERSNTSTQRSDGSRG